MFLVYKLTASERSWLEPVFMKVHVKTGWNDIRSPTSENCLLWNNQVHIVTPLVKPIPTQINSGMAKKYLRLLSLVSNSVVHTTTIPPTALPGQQDVAATSTNGERYRGS
ncbi:hypothetical protein R70211_01361 [Paraburkholderia domus]|uniref:Uncharacterized protein n=1 Tax=Paraburkholderia domus TaxID=2793075 RepID=A0A9N8MTQ3_9BURK|nr:hypothetical protein R70211_01361 [Paraburkholderia domus]